MTQNQIAYKQAQETKRHNVMFEAETQRHNLVTEALDLRAKQLQEAANVINQEHFERQDATQAFSAQATAAHYQRSDAINAYSAEQTAAHYQRQDSINAYSAEQTAAHYQRQDAINAYSAQQTAAHYERADTVAAKQLDEQARHNAAQEFLQGQSNIITGLRQREEARHNIELERISESYNSALASTNFLNAFTTQSSNAARAKSDLSQANLNQAKVPLTYAQAAQAGTQSIKNVTGSLRDLSDIALSWKDFILDTLTGRDSQPVSISNNNAYYDQYGNWVGQ